MKIADLSPRARKKIEAVRWDRIIEKHEGPESWESVFKYYDVEFLEVEDQWILLPIERSLHPNITILRTIWSKSGNSVTLFLKDTTYDDNMFSSGFMAVCDLVKGESFFLAIVYHEWFIIEPAEGVFEQYPIIKGLHIGEDSITAILDDGWEISIPIAWSFRLFEATPAQLEDFQIDASGYSIHWQAFDETISIKKFVDGLEYKYSDIKALHIDTKTLTATLDDGREASIPIAWSERLSRATPEQLKDFEIDPSGDGIHWEAVDEDISIKTFLDGWGRR